MPAKHDLNLPCCRKFLRSLKYRTCTSLKCKARATTTSMSIASANRFPHSPTSLARKISDRHFGVGSDGLILICKSQQADARMRMFNADGSESEMCGNGIRCVAKYVYDHGICRNETLRIETGRGILALKLEVAGGRVQRVRVDMGEPILEPARIPTFRSVRRRSDRRFPGLTSTFRSSAAAGWRTAVGPADDVRFDGQSACASSFVDSSVDDRFRWSRWAVFRDGNRFSRRDQCRIRAGPRAGEVTHADLGARSAEYPGLRHRGLRRLRGRRAERPNRRKILAHLPGGDLELHWADRWARPHDAARRGSLSAGVVRSP